MIHIISQVCFLHKDVTILTALTYILFLFSNIDMFKTL